MAASSILHMWSNWHTRAIGSMLKHFFAVTQYKIEENLGSALSNIECPALKVCSRKELHILQMNVPYTHVQYVKPTKWGKMLYRCIILCVVRVYTMNTCVQNHVKNSRQQPPNFSGDKTQPTQCARPVVLTKLITNAFIDQQHLLSTDCLEPHIIAGHNGNLCSMTIHNMQFLPFCWPDITVDR